MKLFRQDKIELTRGDYQLIAAYVLVMCLWLGYRFYVEEIGLAMAVAHVLNSAVEVLASFFLIKVIVETFFLRRRQLVVGIILIVLGLILVGGVGLIVRSLSDGYPIRNVIYPVHAFIVQSLNNSLFDVALLIGFVFSKKSYEQLMANKDLAIENRENALKILRAQFSPHFLFNNLNTIDALIDERPAVAKKYVSHLASLYRYLTQTVNQDIMPLADELKFIRDYLFLIEVRYGDDYSFGIEILGDTTDRYLPSGALQTVLENVVKHNAVDDDRIVTSIVVTRDSVTIANTKGVGSRGVTTGTGLTNLIKRYALLDAGAPVIKDHSDRYEIQLPLVQVAQL